MLLYHSGKIALRLHSELHMYGDTDLGLDVFIWSDRVKEAEQISFAEFTKS